MVALYARRPARQARRRVRADFAWPEIAANTAAGYESARAQDAVRVAREAENVPVASGPCGELARHGTTRTFIAEN